MHYTAFLHYRSTLQHCQTHTKPDRIAIMSQTKRLSNKEIITYLKETLAALEVKETNRFRIRAYQNAISSIEALTSSVYDLWESGRLDEIAGVGEGLKYDLQSLFERGFVPEHENLKKQLPQGMFALIGLRGIGAKKAFKLSTAFKLDNRETAMELLKTAAEQRKIQVLDGFGEKSEKDILAALTDVKKTKNEKPRLLLIHAEEIAERVITYVKQYPAVLEVKALGSLRRRQSTVGDLDIAVSSNDIDGVLEHFSKFSEIGEIIARGDKKIQAVLTNDLQIDLRVSQPQAYGAMLQYFTGSKQHNVALRTFSLESGKSLSEYGIKYQNKLHEFATEEEFYGFVGLPYITPELRQGKNEVELARKNTLPDLIKLSDIKGDIHTHTTNSDGTNSLDEMTDVAQKLGYSYYGIADHAPSVTSRGYDEVERIVATHKTQIRVREKELSGIKLLFGYEVNILNDATLGMPDELLKELDYVVASIHTSFTQDRDTVTDRLIKAIENPYVNVIGHPSGRLINEREACDIDWRKVFDALEYNDKIIEINSQPQRLDLADDLVLEAMNKGIKIIINTDAHAISDLGFMKYGVDVARRGFCEAKNIVNTLPLNEFLRVLKVRNL